VNVSAASLTQTFHSTEMHKLLRNTELRLSSRMFFGGDWEHSEPNAGRWIPSTFDHFTTL